MRSSCAETGGGPDGRAATVPSTVAAQLPRKARVIQQRIEDGGDLALEPRILHGGKHLDSVVEVSWHQVSATDPSSCPILRLEGEDAAVLEKAAQDAPDC